MRPSKMSVPRIPFSALVIAVVLLVSLGQWSSLDVTRAQAQENSRQRVLVVNAAPESVSAQELLWKTREAIGEMAGLESIDLLGLLDGEDPRGVDASLDALKSGERAFDAFDFSVAEDALSRSFEGLAGWSQFRPQAVRAGLLLAQTYAAKGKMQASKRTWARVLALEPRFRLDDPNIAPSIRRSLEDARQVHEERPVRTLNIESSSRVRAGVFIDGRFVGLTPLRKLRIYGDHHHVRVSADGYRHLNKFIRVQRRLSIKFRPKKAERYALFRAIQSKLPREYSPGDMTGFLLELKALAMSDQAVLLSETGSESTAALLDLSRRTIASTARVQRTGESQSAIELLDLLYGGLDRNAPARPTVPTDTGVSVGPSESVNWLLWGGIGAATLAAIIIPLVLWPDGDDGIPSRSGTGAVLLRF